MHKQLKFSLRKNWRWYSSIGAWLVIAFVALTHNEFECLKYLIYRPFLVYEGSIERRSLSKKSRKCLPLKSDTWKVIYQFLIMLLHSCFLSKSYDVLYESSSVRLNFFVFLSTIMWRNHLLSLGQFQNSIEFNDCLLKSNQRFLEIAINYCWYR